MSSVEGAIGDSRTIQRSWIDQMAKDYDPAKYQAGVNMEHIKGYLPESTFGNYGVGTARLSAAR